MTPANVAPVAYIEGLDGGAVITFDDGEGAFVSAALLHKAVSEAKELSEFSATEHEFSVTEMAAMTTCMPGHHASQ
jgi:hypothetical protein